MEKYNYDFRVADHHKLTILSDSESEKKRQFKLATQLIHCTYKTSSLNLLVSSYVVSNPIKYREHILTSAYELGYKYYDTNGE